MPNKIAAVRKGLLAAGAGLANASFWHPPGSPGFKDLADGNWDRTTAQIGGANFGLGMAAVYAKNPALRLAAFLGAPAKDLILSTTKTLPKLERSMSDLAEKPTPKGMSRGAILGTAGAAAGVTGAGLLLHHTLARRRKKKELEQQAQLSASTPGRVQVKLPRDDSTGKETVVEFPFEEVGLSNAMRQQLHRDVRRRLRQGGQMRTIPRLKAATQQQPAPAAPAVPTAPTMPPRQISGPRTFLNETQGTASPANPAGVVQPEPPPVPAPPPPPKPAPPPKPLPPQEPKPNAWAQVLGSRADRIAKKMNTKRANQTQCIKAALYTITGHIPSGNRRIKSAVSYEYVSAPPRRGVQKIIPVDRPARATTSFTPGGSSAPAATVSQINQPSKRRPSMKPEGLLRRAMRLPGRAAMRHPLLAALLTAGGAATAFGAGRLTKHPSIEYLPVGPDNTGYGSIRLDRGWDGNIQYPRTLSPGQRNTYLALAQAQAMGQNFIPGLRGMNAPYAP